jgi:hypothetical protein
VFSKVALADNTAAPVVKKKMQCDQQWTQAEDGLYAADKALQEMHVRLKISNASPELMASFRETSTALAATFTKLGALQKALISEGF